MFLLFTRTFTDSPCTKRENERGIEKERNLWFNNQKTYFLYTILDHIEILTFD